MAADKGNIYPDVKGIFLREIEIPDNAFGMDVSNGSFPMSE